MKILGKTEDGLKKCYNILITKEELDNAMAASLQDVAKNVRLDGFRPGKVPLDVVKRMYSASLVDKSRKLAIDNAAERVIKDDDLRISLGYSTRIVADSEKEIEFTLDCELIPSFELKAVDGFNIKKHIADITEKEENEALECIRARQKRWIDAVALDVKEGHRVTIDLCIFASNRKQKDNVLNGVEIVIGDRSLVDDFWKHLLGAKINEVREFLIHYPKDFLDKSFAGKTVKHRAVITKIQESTEYTLDDDFAKSIGYNSLEEAKNWSRSQAISKYDYITNDLMRRDLLEHLSNLYDFDLPENMVAMETKEVEVQIKDEADRLGKQITPHILKECKQLAENRVRLGFIVAEVAKQNGINVSQNEINQTIMNIAAKYPGQEKSVLKAYYDREDSLQTIIGQILETKVVNFLFKEIKIEEKKCSIEELIAMDEEPFEFFVDDDSHSDVAKSDTSTKGHEAVKKSKKKN